MGYNLGVQFPGCNFGAQCTDFVCIRCGVSPEKNKTCTLKTNIPHRKTKRCTQFFFVKRFLHSVRKNRNERPSPLDPYQTVIIAGKITNMLITANQAHSQIRTLRSLRSHAQDSRSTQKTFSSESCTQVFLI